MNSFLSWIGGKKALRDVIIQSFPSHYERYIEVFGGGGWILFHKPPEPFEVYNDYNSNLTNLFHVVKYKPLAFLTELGWLPLNGREEFELLKKWIAQDSFQMPYLEGEFMLAEKYLKDLELEEYVELIQKGRELGDVRKAAAFYKLIRYSYASGCTSFSCQPTDILKTYRTIWMANARLNGNGLKGFYDGKKGIGVPEGKGVIIENKSYEVLIRQYDRENAFFYCDPPYYKTEDYYAALFSESDHKLLKDTLLQIQGKFLLSYNDCDYIRSLYDGCYIKNVERINNISQRYEPGNLFQELLIANYNMEGQAHDPKQMSLL